MGGIGQPGRNFGMTRAVHVHVNDSINVHVDVNVFVDVDVNVNGFSDALAAP